MAPRITTQSDVKVVRLKPTRLTGLILSKIFSDFNRHTVTPIGSPPQPPVAQKIADQPWLIANTTKSSYLFLYKTMFLKAG